MNPQEEWRPIPGFDGYEVSNLGRVMSYKGKQPRLLSLNLDKQGYPRVSLQGDRQKTSHVHRLVALAFLGPLPAGLETLHRDGNKLNSALTNLHYSTRFENAQDTVRHGQHPNANRTECSEGHAFDDTNTYRHSGRRHCRTCNTQRQRDSRTRRAFSAANIQTTEVAA